MCEHGIKQKRSRSLRWVTCNFHFVCRTGPIISKSFGLCKTAGDSRCRAFVLNRSCAWRGPRVYRLGGACTLEATGRPPPPGPTVDAEQGKGCGLTPPCPAPPCPGIPGDSGSRLAGHELGWGCWTVCSTGTPLSSPAFQNCPEPLRVCRHLA